jgi:hypothetical protein
MAVYEKGNCIMIKRDLSQKYKAGSMFEKQFF